MYAPRIDRVARGAMSCEEMERTFGVRIAPEVARLWNDTEHHRRVSQRSEEWHELRGKYVTGSRVGAILNQSEYDDAHDTFLSYTPNAIPFTSNVATRWGTHYEDEAVYCYEEAMARVGRQVFVLPFDFVICPEHPKMFAYSPDGITNDGRLIEVKCPYRRKIVPGVVPISYYEGQIQFGLYCLKSYGIEVCDYVEYRPGTCLSITHLGRDRAWSQRNVATLVQFWRDLNEFKTTGQYPQTYQWCATPHRRKHIDEVRRDIRLHGREIQPESDYLLASMTPVTAEEFDYLLASVHPSNDQCEDSMVSPSEGTLLANQS